MKWILLLVYFAGPTSPDRIQYGGTFATEAACHEHAKSEQASESWYDSHSNPVCIPLGDAVR